MALTPQLVVWQARVSWFSVQSRRAMAQCLDHQGIQAHIWKADRKRFDYEQPDGAALFRRNTAIVGRGTRCHRTEAHGLQARICLIARLKHLL